MHRLAALACRARSRRRYATAAPALGGALLVANRGEIALRVFRTAKRLGIPTVAVYSDADARAAHVAAADAAVRLGPPPPPLSYLCHDAVLAAAAATGAAAIHPGYGFLSESASFADACAARGVTFVGPPAAAIRAMGDKAASKAIMLDAGVPVVPGYHGDDQSDERLIAEAASIGYPIMVKAVAGGGGKGMKIAHTPAELPAALAAARAEAASAVGDDRLLLERLLVRPRHVEVQVFADAHGGCVHLAERDCSVQRRHQKVIEEAPAPRVDAEFRARLGAAAVAAARAVGYVGAGTVEFMLDGATGDPFFCEMNTRLQVEHPVTEAVVRVKGAAAYDAAGLDLVELQLRVAAGERLPFSQSDVSVAGHAVEGRIYAERPEAGFLPAAGTLTALAPPPGAAAFEWPAGATVRLDAGVRAGDGVGVFYDPMIGKILARGPDRPAAFAAMASALDALRVGGLHTNVGLLSRLARCDALGGVDAAPVDTSFLASPVGAALLAPPPPPPHALAAAALASHAAAAAQAAAKAGGGAWAATDGARPGTGLPTRRPLVLRDDESGCVATVVVETAGGDGAVRVACGGEEEKVAASPSSRPAPPPPAFDLTLTSPTVTPPAAADGLWTVTAVDAASGVRVAAAAALGADGDDSVVDVWLTSGPAAGARATLRTPIPRKWGDGAASTGGGDEAAAPMPGRVARVVVKEGDHVQEGDTLAIVEAMKMEHPVPAPRAGVVRSIEAVAGAVVAAGDVLVVLESEKEETTAAA